MTCVICRGAHFASNSKRRKKPKDFYVCGCGQEWYQNSEDGT